MNISIDSFNGIPPEYSNQSTIPPNNQAAAAMISTNISTLQILQEDASSDESLSCFQGHIQDAISTMSTLQNQLAPSS